MIDTEADLREGLRHLAVRGEPSIRVKGPSVVRERYRTLRRQRTTLLTVAAAVLVLVIAVPLGLNAIPGDNTGPPGDQAPRILDVPTRGSLADDQQFLEDFATEFLSGEGVTDGSDPEYPHIVFAGDVDAGRWVAEVDEVGDQLYVGWYTVRPGLRLRS